MRLQQIEALIAISEAGSIRSAARRLNVSQPALTKSVKALEEEFSVPLVQRTPRGILLTDYGRAVLTRAQSVSAEVARMREEIEQMRGHLQGTVTVAVSPVPALLLLPTAIARFRRKMPEVQLRVEDGIYPAVLPLVRNGTVDLAIGPQPPEHVLSSDLEVESLFSNELVVAARRGHPLGGRRSLSELMECAWLMHGPASGPGSLFEPAFVQHGLVPPRPVVCSQSFTATIALLEAGDLLTVLPRRITAHYVRQQRLCAIEVDEKLPSWDVCMLTRAGVPLTPVAREFATTVRRSPVTQG